MLLHLKNTALRLALLMLNLNTMAQLSPLPTISSYGGRSLTQPHSMGDSTFCKSGRLMITGADFETVSGAETWDTTEIWLGGYQTGLQCAVLNWKPNPFGTGDTAIVQIPGGIWNDTCMAVDLVKFTLSSFGRIPYAVRDTICLIGDKAEAIYSDSVFCLGDTNPRPIHLASTDSSGVFCCPSGVSGFYVQPDGTIPLHGGAVGTGQGFLYTTTHPACPDTLSFQVDIFNTAPSTATYGGQASILTCPSGGMLSDTASLWPKGGRFSCSSSGLVILDDSTGLLDFGTSLAGTYDLIYDPDLPCHAPAVIQVTILPLDTASVSYPLPYQGGFQVLCQDAPILSPIFQNGNSGGDFVSLPSGLSLDWLGRVDASQSVHGNYAVMYVTIGPCPDTVTAALNLRVDTVADASFTLSDSLVCEGTQSIGATAATQGGGFQVFSYGYPLFSSPTPVLAVGGLNPGASYMVEHRTGTACPDTAVAFFTVQERDDASFQYDPDLYCIIDADPAPISSGTTGGTYSALTGGTVIDSVSGRIDLAQSGAGQHVIRYATKGYCADTALDSIDIQNAANAQFSYPSSAFCISEPDPSPVVSLQGGVFQSSPTGLALDQITGEIDLSTSAPGGYQVSYSFISTCQTSYTQTLTVESPGPPTTLQYANDTFCKGAIPVAPNLSGDTIGVFVPSPGLFLLPGGVVDLTATPAGSYWVRFDVANRCASDPTDTLSVKEVPTISLTYPTPSMCNGESPQAPDVQVTPIAGGGAFSASSGLSLDSLGVVDPSRSLPGGYTVTYAIYGSCPASASAEISIHPGPDDLKLVLSDTATCQGTPLDVRIDVSGAVEFGYLLNGAPLDSGNLSIQLSGLANGDFLEGWVANGFGCADTVGEVLRIRPRPLLAGEVQGGPIVDNGGLAVRLETDLPGTVVDWRLVGLDLIEEGRLEFQGNSELLELDAEAGESDPLHLALLLTPQFEGCVGNQFSLDLSVIAAPFFIPEVFTPDGNGQNDTWKIMATGLADPSEYEILLFNRGGGMVHRMHPLNDQWNGGSLPDGVYWWKLRGTDGREIESGGVTIKRK